MSNIDAQISVLKQTADPAVADTIAELIKKGEEITISYFPDAGVSPLEDRHTKATIKYG